MDLEEGFEKGQSDNLPKIDVLTVVQYFSGKRNYLAKMKPMKSGSEEYGDDAIGNVQIKRDGNVCTVKCCITPEQNVEPYHSTLIFNENEGRVKSISCANCSTRGDCKHTVAFLMWLHRRTEEPDATSVKCYWRNSTLSGIETSLFIKAKDFGNRLPQVDENKGKFDGSLIIDEVKEMIRKSGIKCPLGAYFLDTPEIDKLSMHYIICNFKKESENLEFPIFLAYCATQFTEERCILVENETMTQSYSELWNEMHYGRVTASQVYEAAHCRKEDGDLVEEILGDKSLLETNVTETEKLLKDSVRKQVAKLKKLKLKQSGLILSPDLPICCVSLDGMTKSHVIEIKTPLKDATYKSYYKNGKISKKYYAQIQTQMHLTKKKKGLFCVAHKDYEVSKIVDIHEVSYDKDYCDDLFFKVTSFWEEFIFGKL